MICSLDYSLFQRGLHGQESRPVSHLTPQILVVPCYGIVAALNEITLFCREFNLAELPGRGTPGRS